MKRQIIISLVMAATLVGCNEKAAEQAPVALELDSMEKKVSYFIGYNTARQLQSEGFTLDEAALSAGAGHLNTGAEPLLTEEEMQAVMTAFQTQIQEKRQNAYNEDMENNLKQGQAFLAANAEREGVVVTDSGLQYEVLAAGTGASPKSTDKVKVNYKGNLISGELFDQGEGVSFTVNHLIPGWVEALPLMKVGAKWKLFVPSELAYGAGGTGKIGPNSTLTFEMELLEIEAPASE